MRLLRHLGPRVRSHLATTHCATCDHGITLVDPHPAAAVEHRCPTGVVGPVWTVVEPPTGGVLAAVADRASA